MRRIVTGFICAGLSMGAVVAGTTPALASTKKVPVLAVKQSATKVATGGSVTFTPALHLPAHDKLASWALTFGDGSKSGAKARSLPHSVKHTYKKKFSGHAVLTVTDAKKRHWSVSLPISVVTLTFAGGGAATTSTTPATTTPSSATCIDPTGQVTGKVSSGSTALAGVSVSISDADSSDATLAVTTTNCHGAWAVPASVHVGPDGFDIKINTNGVVADTGTDSYAPTNQNYDVREYNVVPIGSALSSDLPATAIVSGTVSPDSGPLPADVVVTAIGQPSDSSVADQSILTTYSTVSPTGAYRLALGVGTDRTWNLVVSQSLRSLLFPTRLSITSTAPLTENLSY